jgi:hypothetical protein
LPIHRRVEGEAFQSEDITLMSNVFEDVLHTLGLVDREDPVTTLVAKKLIEIVQAARAPDSVARRELTGKEKEAIGRPHQTPQRPCASARPDERVSVFDLDEVGVDRCLKERSSSFTE